MARVLYVSQGYCTHDRRFLERLVRSHEMWFLPCEAISIRSDLSLPPGIRTLAPLNHSELRPETSAWTVAIKRFQRIIREVSPDLVHAGPIQLGGFLTALADFHPALMMSWGSDVLMTPDRECSAKKIVQFSLQHCDMAIADCEVVRERIMSLGGVPPERIVTLPWGVDLKVFRPKRSSLGLRQRLEWRDCKVIISTRALEASHCPFIFLKAIKRILDERDDVRVLILGDGRLRNTVDSFIHKNDLPDRVHLASQVPESALADYFAEADLYVSAACCDGTSISLLQAMACGLPAVVANAYGNKEWVKNGENGWLFPPEDDQALAKAILQALADDDARRIAGEANIRIARGRADWERNFPLVLRAYEQTAGRNA